MRYRDRRAAMAAVGLTLVLLSGCAGGTASSAAVRIPPNPVQVANVQRATVGTTFTFTGSVVPVSSVDVQPRQAGRVLSLNVSVGQKVQEGAVLAQLDQTQQQLAAEQAKASLEQAQAKLDAIKAGPRPEQVAEAQIAVDVAKSKLQAMLNGPKPANVASAEANVRSAQAAADAAEQKVASLVHPRPETIEQVKAQLVMAEQNLQALQKGRPQQVAQAQLALDEAKQRLSTIQAGPRPQVVGQAQAQVLTAQAQLAALRNGPSAADLVPLQQAVEIAKNNLNAAQISRDSTCAQVGKPAGFGTVGTQTACNAANAQVNAAQSSVDEAIANLQKAQQPPSATDLQRAQAGVQSAQAALQQAEHPYTSQDVAQAQDAVNVARAQLAIAEQPGSAQDLAKAQAAVQSAQAALTLAEHPASPQDLQVAKDAAIQAQAAVTQAAQNLNLVQNPYTVQDIEQAKLAVQNAQEQLALTKQPYTAQDVEQAQAAVDQVKAAYDQAEQNLKDTTVTAPISGVITEKNVSRGVLAGPNTTLVTIASPEDDVEINVPETEIAGMVAGKPVTINAQTAGATEGLKGKVTNVAPSADAKSRAFLVKVAPDTATAPLLPGTFATVTITPEEHANVLAVPSDSIVQRGGKPVVFVVQNGMAKQVPVSVGLSNGTLTEIVSGVQPGWEVIMQGQDTLVDGDHVSVAKAPG